MGFRGAGQALVTELAPGRVLEFTMADGGRALSTAQAIDAWRSDEAFCAAFTACLCDCPFEAAFFEMPPLTRGNLDQPLRFVLVDAPALAGLRADPRPFADRYPDSAAGDILVFGNLGGDAVLVVPSPQPGTTDAAHLLSYLRSAPADRSNALWRHAATALVSRVGDKPVWLSTSGLGVAWLHLRLDDRPKYYTWRPYAQYRAS